MTGGDREQTTRFRPRGLPASVAMLSAVLAASYLLLAPFVYRLQGADGLSAAAVAAVVCLVSALAGLLVSQCFSGPDHALAGVLVGMGFRMTLPLTVCVVAQLQGGALAQAGFVFYIIAFYLVSLAIDTWLATGRTFGVGPTSEDS